MEMQCFGILTRSFSLLTAVDLEQKDRETATRMHSGIMGKWFSPINDSFHLRAPFQGRILTGHRKVSFVMRKKSGSLFNLTVCMLGVLAFGTKLDWGWQYLPKTLLTYQSMFDQVSTLTCLEIQCKILFQWNRSNSDKVFLEIYLRLF